MANTAHDTLSPVRIQMGSWTIDAAARQVDGPNGSVRIEPKAMSVLLELANNPDQVVGRQQLLERGWGPEMATDDVLSRAISELRRALGDDPRNPRIIVTVRGAGYRLVLPEPNGEARHVERVPVAAPRQRTRSRFVIAATAAVTATVATLITLAGLRSAEPNGEGATVAVHVTPITTHPGQESAPRLSPDGTRIAYAWRDEARQTQQIYVRLIDGSAELRVTSGSGDYSLAAWSPDGSRLAVARADGGTLGIYEVSSLGGGERLVTSVAGPYILGLDWSRDGRGLVYSSLDSTTSSFGVRVLDPESHREQRLTSGARDAFGDVYPIFSPDGQRVAFVRFFSEIAADVYVMPSTGGPPQRLTHDEQPIGAIAFDSDGRSLLYSANRDAQTAVWRIAADGSDSSPRKVYDSSHGISGLAAMRTGAGIVVAESDQDLNLWTAAVDHSRPPRQVVASTRLDALPRYSPDGARIAFVSDRSGPAELWVSDTAGSSPVRLTQIGGVSGVPSWSPNGSYIAVERQVQGRSELWIVDVAHRTSKSVQTSLRGALAPSWSPDGRSIFVSSRHEGKWQVFEVEVDGGAVAPLTTSGGMAARPSPDGRAILFAKPYQRGLWRLDLATRAESLVTPELGAGDCTNWDVAADGVYLVTRGTDGRQSIVFARFGTDTVSMIARNVRVPVGAGGIALSPDGRTVIYAQSDRRDGDLVLISRP